MLQVFYVTEGWGTVYDATTCSGDDIVSGRRKTISGVATRLIAHLFDGAVYSLSCGGRHAMSETSAAEMRRRPQRDERVCARLTGNEKRAAPVDGNGPFWRDPQR